MMNLHARELERILLERDLRIVKGTETLWSIVGPGGRTVHYAPGTGKCWSWTPGTEGRKSEQLRGSAMRIAEILQELVQ